MDREHRKSPTPMPTEAARERPEGGVGGGAGGTMGGVMRGATAPRNREEEKAEALFVKQLSQEEVKEVVREDTGALRRKRER